MEHGNQARSKYFPSSGQAAANGQPVAPHQQVLQQIPKIKLAQDPNVVSRDAQSKQYNSGTAAQNQSQMASQEQFTNYYIKNEEAKVASAQQVKNKQNILPGNHYHSVSAAG